MTRRPSRLQVASATILRPDQSYHVLRYRQEFVNPNSGLALATIPYPIKKIEASGDHLYVSQINGPMAIYVKIGSFRNPWIRLEERQTYKRSFRTLWFTTADVGGQIASEITYNEAVCYVSNGPLVEPVAKTPGIREGFITNRFAVVASPAFTDILEEMVNISVSFRKTTAGINGGWLKLRNTGAVPVDIFSNSASPDGYRMGTGEIMDVPLNGKLGSIMAPGNTLILSPVASGVGGAGELSCILSPWETDNTIPETVPSLGLGG